MLSFRTSVLQGREHVSTMPDKMEDTMTDAASRNRPVDETEIEVTDEMVNAGVGAFLDGDRRFETELDVVIRVYEAMVRARPATTVASHVSKRSVDCSR